MAKKKEPIKTTELMDDLLACSYDKDDPASFVFELKKEVGFRLERAKTAEQRKELIEALTKLSEIPLYEIAELYEEVMTHIREEDHWEYMVNPNANLMQCVLGTIYGECFWMTLENGKRELFEKQCEVEYDGKDYALLISITREGGKDIPQAEFYEFIEGETREEDKVKLVTDQKLLKILCPLASKKIDDFRKGNGWK